MFCFFFSGPNKPPIPPAEQSSAFSPPAGGDGCLRLLGKSSMVTFLSLFLRSFCLFVCFLSPQVRKTCFCALADSCPRSLLYRGLTVGPQPLPVAQATKSPPVSRFSQEGAALRASQRSPGILSKEPEVRRVQEGGRFVPKLPPATDLSASWAQGLPWGTERWQPCTLGIVSTLLLGPCWHSPQERFPWDADAGETSSCLPLTHLSFRGRF